MGRGLDGPGRGSEKRRRARKMLRGGDGIGDTAKTSALAPCSDGLSDGGVPSGDRRFPLETVEAPLRVELSEYEPTGL